MPKIYQISNGTKFGRLTVIRESEPIIFPSGKKRQFTCLCECGKTKNITAQSLVNGKSQSCGCMRSEQLKKRKTKHGHTIGGKRSPEHSAWHSMLQRCKNPKHKRYSEWGGRGIKVCKRWEEFDNFFADMGKKPSLNHSLDRFPDTNGDYEPSNCRWATNKEQCNNKRKNHLLTFNGKTQTLTQWAEETGMKHSVLSDRIASGWTTKDALTIPVNPGQKIFISSRRRKPN